MNVVSGFQEENFKAPVKPLCATLFYVFRPIFHRQAELTAISQQDVSPKEIDSVSAGEEKLSRKAICRGENKVNPIWIRPAQRQVFLK